MIRELKSFEVGICCAAGQMFFQESKVPGGFDPVYFEKNWRQDVANGTGVILAAFDGENQLIGAIAGHLGPDPFNGEKVAWEAFWYMIAGHRGSGLRLLKAFETWAVSRQAKRISMVHLESLQPEILQRVYERNGYRRIETSYLKEL